MLGFFGEGEGTDLKRYHRVSLSHVVDLGVSADNTYLQEGLEVHLRDGNVPGLMSLCFILIFPISCTWFF